MKLEKFDRNKKQKRVVIASIVGLLLVIGVITLYRTFALYEEKQEFNVLQGRVSNFVKINTTILVDGNPVEELPEKESGYTVENIACNNEEKAIWNSEEWKIEFENPTSATVTCEIEFYSEFYRFAKFAKIIDSNATNMSGLLANMTDVENMVSSQEAMNQLIRSESLRNSLKNNENYTTDVAKKILNSTVVSEEEKYNVGLPFYLYNNLEDNVTNGYDSYINPVGKGETSFTIVNDKTYIQASYANTYITIVSKNKINTSNYHYLEMPVSYYTNHSNLTGTITIGFSTDATDDFEPSFTKTFDSDLANDTLLINLNDDNDLYHFKIRLNHNGQVKNNTVAVIIDSIALY